MIAYNIIRGLMLQSARTYNVPVCRISFKGTCDTLRQWAPIWLPLSQFRQFTAGSFVGCLKLLQTMKCRFDPIGLNPELSNADPKTIVGSLNRDISWAIYLIGTAQDEITIYAPFGTGHSIP